MRKPSFVFGKKQIVLAGLTLILGAAIYVNYILSDTQNQLKPAGQIDSSGLAYGDAQYVNTDASDEDYFAEMRIERMTSRDKAVETLEMMLGGGDITEDEKAAMTEQAVSISALIESESKIENLIKAAGFEDCVVYLDGTSANIVVKSGGLIPSQAAQIKDILLSEVDVANENIRIFDVK